MLLSRIKETNELIRSESEIADIKKRQEDFTRVTNRIEQIYKSFNNYYLTIKTLNTEFGLEFSYNDLNTFRNKLKKLERDLKNEYIDFTLVDSITKEVNELESSLKEKWNLHIVSETNDIINTLGAIKRIVNEKSKLDIVIHSIVKDRVTWPMDNAKLNNIKSRVNECQQIISELELNENINEFIEKIALNKATILDLTPEILAWIKDKGFENNITLKFI